MTWLVRLNGALGVFLILLWGYIAFLTFLGPEEPGVPSPVIQEINLPKHTFEQPSEAYEAIGPPMLSLDFVRPGVTLPDLRRVLTYHGRNNRPDARGDRDFLYVSVPGPNRAPHIMQIVAEERTYLTYSDQESTGHYILSPENAPSSLSIQVDPQEESALITVILVNAEGEEIKKPEGFHRFTLDQRPLPRRQSGTWEIGGIRVDGGLLARQRTLWYGEDKFMEMHGGKENASLAEKQLLTMGDKEQRYTRYVGVGDQLLWKEGKWVPIEGVEDSWNYPLLQCEKIEPRMMKFELWDAGGRGRISLNLVRSREVSRLRTFWRDFQLVGTRTRTQTIVEVKGERVIVQPGDWLLRTREGNWTILNTLEEVDGYIERKVTGELLVIDGVEQQEGRPILTAHVFSTNRSVVDELELHLDGKGWQAKEQAAPQEATPPRSASRETAGENNRPPNEEQLRRLEEMRERRLEEIEERRRLRNQRRLNQESGENE